MPRPGVIDQQVVEIFTDLTPFSFFYEPLGGGLEVELEGPGLFGVAASAVCQQRSMGHLRVDADDYSV